MINTSKAMPNLLQNLGFLQGLKFFKKRRPLVKVTPALDFWSCSALIFSNQISFFLCQLQLRYDSHSIIVPRKNKPHLKKTGCGWIFHKSQALAQSLMVMNIISMKWFHEFYSLKPRHIAHLLDQKNRNLFLKTLSEYCKFLLKMLKNEIHAILEVNAD